MRIVVAALVFAGCSGVGICVDGVCANPDERRALPGPCAAREVSPPTGTPTLVDDTTFAYDGESLVHVDEHGTRMTRDGEVDTTGATDWSYDATGAPSAIHATGTALVRGSSSSVDIAWAFDATSVTDTVTRTPYGGGPGGPSTTTQVYDRGRFTFLPLVGDALASPSGGLGLVREDTVTYTWTDQDGSETRSGSDGTTTIYEVDDQRRILSYGPAGGPERERWTFDGDRLIRHEDERTVPVSVTDYRYDRGGNLIETTTGDTTTVYTYDCW